MLNYARRPAASATTKGNVIFFELSDFLPSIGVLQCTPKINTGLPSFKGKGVRGVRGVSVEEKRKNTEGRGGSKKKKKKS